VTGERDRLSDDEDRTSAPEPANEPLLAICDIFVDVGEGLAVRVPAGRRVPDSLRHLPRRPALADVTSGFESGAAAS
jgi:hypothetical protein